ncbi:prolyl oligopeptidase family serine peptidase [Corallococcus sp. bb12-1]|uniref:alpha/beta hydrolase family protein n=1 Tax=Corallococcus sp. bb12-1 TaxID=2996784 RepID=UPI00226EF3EA|nr:prolyl oligopeptidase family serine peptidase [Corallococcus sp. bb12-1]MCY1045514.1 prolyl oligopeptidase family serine peptidase [Corallococcus sp. bb12-1]
MPGAHADADSPRVVGTALVQDEASRQVLLQRYPRREPDPDLAARLAVLLTDSGQRLRWSAAPVEDLSCDNGDVRFRIQVRIPPPCAERSCPVLVFYSSACPRPGYHWRPEFFLREGFIYAEPAVRGTRCWEAWARADDGERRMSAATDLEASSRCLRARFIRDGVTPRLGILGWSYGGAQALMGMTRFAGSYDAGFALAAKTDLGSFLLQAPPELRRARADEYGDPATDADRLRAISPITYVDRVQGPIALMLGARDPKVSLSDADVFVRALQARGQDASLMIIPEHAHLTERPEEVVFEHAHILQFLTAKLGPADTDDHAR